MTNNPRCLPLKLSLCTDTGLLKKKKKELHLLKMLEGDYKLICISLIKLSLGDLFTNQVRKKDIKMINIKSLHPSVKQI